jgi:hypothetical protein
VEVVGRRPPGAWIEQPRVLHEDTISTMESKLFDEQWIVALHSAPKGQNSIAQGKQCVALGLQAKTLPSPNGAR